MGFCPGRINHGSKDPWTRGTVCQCGSLAVVVSGIDGIERSSVAVVVSGFICIFGILRISVPEGSHTPTASGVGGLLLTITTTTITTNTTTTTTTSYYYYYDYYY